MSLKELYEEINEHLLKDNKPSLYMKQVFYRPEFHEYPFNMLADMREVEQSHIYHPEGNVWNHTMMVIDEAASIRDKSKEPCVFMWGALLHDIGKPKTTKTKNKKIVSYDHDKVGEKLAVEFLNQFTDDEAFINKVSKLVRYHMHILFVVNDLPFANTMDMIRECDTDEVALLGYSDRMGRKGVDINKEKSNIEMFVKKIEEFKGKNIK
ncbi:HDIG domain-containing protein [Hathewaya proteolytica DSM 3090]|uniref:HDIG domain-containing protein n=1 Tax=Hathewaya proteolytica DSM 3090 TaxID=1121331 RepID=A0A1M6NXE9_9CLOT|nr:HDIG domain-containing metalloprotein [Hathewaya proteolytica]SHK00308.1 HDIG domain-containing protein [Hathewaya proteolytica DSM 3090]